MCIYLMLPFLNNYPYGCFPRSSCDHGPAVAPPELSLAQSMTMHVRAASIRSNRRSTFLPTIPNHSCQKPGRLAGLRHLPSLTKVSWGVRLVSLHPCESFSSLVFVSLPNPCCRDTSTHLLHTSTLNTSTTHCASLTSSR